jgi:hypothetical protein
MSVLDTPNNSRKANIFLLSLTIFLSWLVLHLILLACHSPCAGGTMTSSHELPEATRLLLSNAVQIALILPNRDKNEILWSAGLTAEQTDCNQMKEILRQMIAGYNQTHGRTDLSTMSRCDRVVRLKALMRRHPSKSTLPPKLTDLMKFVGYDDIDATSGSASYMRNYRALLATGLVGAPQTGAATPREARPMASSNASTAAMTDSSLASSDPRSQQPQQRPSRITFRHGDGATATSSAALSPMTWEGDYSGTPHFAFEPRTLEPDDFFDNHFVWPLPFFAVPPEHEPQKQSTLVPLPTRSKPVSIQTLTTTKSHRQTSQATHQERQLIVEAQGIRSSMHKVGSVL